MARPVVSQPPPGLAGIIIFRLAAARAAKGMALLAASAAAVRRKVSRRMVVFSLRSQDVDRDFRPTAPVGRCGLLGECADAARVAPAGPGPSACSTIHGHASTRHEGRRSPRQVALGGAV